MAAGELALALDGTRFGLDHATSRGAAAPAEWSVLGMGHAQLFAGDVTAAEATLFTWAEEFGIHVPVTMPFWGAGLAEVHRQRDRMDKAEEAISSGREWHNDFQGALAYNARGMLRLTAGRFAEGLADFERAAGILTSFAARPAAFIPWRLGAALALNALGRTDEARAVAEEQLADALRWGAAPLLGGSLRTMATVVGGEEGIALAEEAVAVLAPSQAVGEHTEALLVLGRLQRVKGARACAQDVLAQALDQAERRGASLLARLIVDELRMLGARPRRRAMTGMHALTPAELRVASLAAKGLSNPEIAQSLFVTRKTVEKHLGAAFAKLHISSRDQLPAVLEHQ